MSVRPFLLLTICLGVLLTLGGTGCRARKAGRTRLGEVERLPRLETVKPAFHDNLKVVRSYTATIETLERAELCTQVRGSVKPIPKDIDIGRVIKINEKLLELDVPDFVADRENKRALWEQAVNQQALAEQAQKVAAAEVIEAKAQLERFQADIEFRKLHYARVIKLAQGDTVAQQLAEESQWQLNTSKAALSAGQAALMTRDARAVSAEKELAVAVSRVKVAKAEFERLDALVGYATVKAPFNGVITKRWVDTGATVRDSTTPLLTVVRTDRVRVILDIPERDVPHIVMDSAAGKGNAVELDIPALRERTGKHRFSGTVTLKAAALDPTTRTMRTEMHLDNDDGLLNPQMTGKATVTLAERKAMTIPSSALVRTGDKIEVFYVADPVGDPPRGVVRRKEVELGLDDGLRVEIRAGRLTGQELIITKVGVVRAGDQAIAVPARGAEVP